MPHGLHGKASATVWQNFLVEPEKSYLSAGDRQPEKSEGLWRDGIPVFCSSMYVLCSPGKRLPLKRRSTRSPTRAFLFYDVTEISLTDGASENRQACSVALDLERARVGSDIKMQRHYTYYKAYSYAVPVVPECCLMTRRGGVPRDQSKRYQRRQTCTLYVLPLAKPPNGGDTYWYESTCAWPRRAQTHLDTNPTGMTLRYPRSHQISLVSSYLACTVVPNPVTELPIPISLLPSFPNLGMLGGDLPLSTVPSTVPCTAAP